MTAAEAGVRRGGWRALRVVAYVLEILAVLSILRLGAIFRERVAEGWVFAGSDTYGYLALGEELREHHRYALGPQAPLHHSRLPLYPMFLSAVKGHARADMSGGEGWDRIKRAQRNIEVWLAGPLVYLAARSMARRMGWGAISGAAGAVALLCTMLCPFLVLFAATALTECLATALTVATIAPLLWGRSRPRLWYPVAALFLALSALTRPDGLLLAVAFVPALLLLRSPGNVWRERLIVAGMCAYAFVLVYGLWPARNLMRFGRPYFVGTRVDRFTNPLPNYTGYWNWLRTWGEDQTNQTGAATCFFNPPCPASIDHYPPMAFAGPDPAGERATVEALLARRMVEGLSPGVSAGFQKLADARRRRDRYAFEIGLPLSRAYHMWVSTHDEVLQNPIIPYPAVIGRWRPQFERHSRWLFWATLAGGLFLLLLPRGRGDALVLLLPIVARSLILPYALYSMSRYTNEVLPLCFILIGVALTSPLALLQALVRWVLARARSPLGPPVHGGDSDGAKGELLSKDGRGI